MKVLWVALGSLVVFAGVVVAVTRSYVTLEHRVEEIEDALPADGDAPPFYVNLESRVAALEAASPAADEARRSLESRVAVLESADGEGTRSYVSLERRVTALEDASSEVAVLPPGAVVAFDQKECPPGSQWVEYPEAYGRFIRGIDKADKPIDPDGLRAPSSTQDHQFAAHFHEQPKDVYDTGVAEVANGEWWGYGHRSPPPTGETGGDETRPVNVALLYCEAQ